MNVAMLPIGVSVLCPGWVQPASSKPTATGHKAGGVPPRAATTEVTLSHLERAVGEGMAPAAVADLVADAIAANRFWVFTDPRFTQMALDRWQRIAEGQHPRPRSTFLASSRRTAHRGIRRCWLARTARYTYPGTRTLVRGGRSVPDDHGSCKGPHYPIVTQRPDGPKRCIRTRVGR